MINEWYRWDGDDLLLSVLIQPKSTKDEFVALQGNAYKLKVTSPPVDGQANAHVLKFLAHAFGVKNKAVCLVAGTTSRRKLVRIMAPLLLPIPVQRPLKTPIF